MQKNIRMILAMLLCLLMIFGLSACRQESEPEYTPESAIALWEKIDKAMNTLQSMEMTTKTKVIFFNSGYQFELNGTAYVLTTKDNHYMESINVVTADELALEQTTKVVEAYYDGQVYIYNNDGIYEQKLCTQMSHEEYDREHGAELTDEIEMADCTKSEFSKGEGDTWKLHFSGYTKKTIDKVLETLNITDDLLGASISDMEVNLVANSDFCVQTMEIRFSFTPAAGLAAPQFTVTAEYSGYNTATFNPRKLNTEEYVAVDDVRVIESLALAIQERQNATSGKFSLEITTSYERPDMTQTSAETDMVSYGRKNGAYFYSITAQMDGQDFMLQYQNGEQTVTAGGQTHTASQTEQEAKSFIDGLIDSAGYNANAVSGVQKLEDNVYVLSCAQLDLTEYTQSLTGNNIELTAGSQQITATFQDGKLVKMECTTRLSGSESAEPMAMVNTTVVTFEDAQETA